MAVWMGMSGGARVAGIAAGVVVVVGAIAVIWPVRAPEPTPEPMPAAVVAVPDATPKAVPDPVPETASVAVPDTVPDTEAVSDQTPDRAEEAVPESAPAAERDPSIEMTADVAAEVPVAEAEAEAEPEVAFVLPEPVVPEPVVPSFDSYRVEADGSAVVSGRAAPLAIVSVLVDGVAVAQATAGGDGSFAALFTLVPNAQPSLMTLEVTLEDGSTQASAQSVALGPIAGPVTIAAAPPEPAAMPEPDISSDVVGEAEAVASVEPPSVPAMVAEAETVAESVSAPEAEVVADAPPTPPLALLVTEEGATVVQAPAGAVADSTVVAAVLLDAISYSPAGAVQLSGKGQTGQTVRIYLDNAPVAEAPIAAPGLWQVTLGDTAPGIYTLRVDQIDAAGAVTARFETPFKRETLEALAALSQTVTPEVEAPTANGEAGDAAGQAPAATTDPQNEDVAVTAAPSVPVALSPTPPGTDALVQAPTLGTEPAPALTLTTGDVAPTPPIPAAAPEQVLADASAAPPTPPPPVSITVQPGFTLWGIARENFGEGIMYVQVYEANRDKIRNPDLIYPGQVFTIPAKP